MIWDEIFIGRVVSFSDIQKAMSQVWKFPEEQIRVLTRKEFKRLALSGGTIPEPIRCEVVLRQGGFPIQLQCWWVGDDIRPPEHREEVLHQLAAIWKCSIITSFEEIDYLLDERDKTHIYVDDDWLKKHNEVVYKIVADDETQLDE